MGKIENKILGEGTVENKIRYLVNGRKLITYWKMEIVKIKDNRKLNIGR